MYITIIIYLCIKVGTRLCETLQNGAEIKWSNSGRLCLVVRSVLLYHKLPHIVKRIHSHKRTHTRNGFCNSCINSCFYKVSRFMGNCVAVENLFFLFLHWGKHFACQCCYSYIKLKKWRAAMHCTLR